MTNDVKDTVVFLAWKVLNFSKFYLVFLQKKCICRHFYRKSAIKHHQFFKKKKYLTENEKKQNKLQALESKSLNLATNIIWDLNSTRKSNFVKNTKCARFIIRPCFQGICLKKCPNLANCKVFHDLRFFYSN